MLTLLTTAGTWLAGAIPETARKWVLAAVALVALVVGGFWYRSHVYDAGVDAGRLAAQQEYDAALATARASDAAKSKAATEALRGQLKEETNAHNLRVAELTAALTRAGADNVRLNDELTRLHNDAVTGRRPGSTGTTPGAGKTPSAPQGAVTVQSGITLRDLMQNDESNYTICRKNARRHQAVLDWYSALRNGDKAGQQRAIEEAGGE